MPRRIEARWKLLTRGPLGSETYTSPCLLSLGGGCSFVLHRDLDALAAGKIDGFFVARIRMAEDAHSWVGCKDSLNTLRHHFAAVRDCHLTGMQGITNTHATTVVNRYPRGAGSRVQHRVQQRPVGYSIAAILHRFCLAEGRGYRTRIQVIAANYDRSLDPSFFHQIVHGQTESGALAITQPADSCRQSLELDPPACQIDPALQDAILRKQFQHQIVSPMNVRRVAG